jgi:hypothetical protein
MGKLNKFEDVDVTASLEAIMKQNTAFYQSDFDIDKEIIKRAAESPNAGDKMLLWFSRPSGTCCIKERDAFLKDTGTQYMEVLRGADPRQGTCLCRGAYRRTGREDHGQSL